MLSSPGDSDWDIFKQDGYQALHRPVSTLRWQLDSPAAGARYATRKESLTESWSFHFKPVEVLILNGLRLGVRGRSTLFGSSGSTRSPRTSLDTIESGWELVWGVRSLQALHRDLVCGILQEWKCASPGERLSTPRSHGPYHILDVHWSDAAPWPNEPDPISGLIR